jgi:hypothetical protein
VNARLDTEQMNAAPVHEYRGSIGTSMSRFLPALLFLIGPWIAVYHDSNNAAWPPPRAHVPLFIFSGSISIMFIVRGLMVATKRLRLAVAESSVEIVESTLFGTRRLVASATDKPEIVFDRNCNGGALWSIALTRPRRFKFGKGLSRDALYEIHELLWSTLAL